MRLKNLATIRTALFLSLSDCSKNQQNIPDVKTQTAKCIIVSIDEDAFAIANATGFGEYPYEILRVRTRQDSIKKIFVSQPTELAVGDTIPDFKPAKRITFNQIAEKYSNPPWWIRHNQKGYLIIDGILERN